MFNNHSWSLCEVKSNSLSLACVIHYRHSPSYAVVTFLMFRHMSNVEQLAIQYTCGQFYVDIQKGVQLKSKLRHTGTRSAAV